MIGRINTSSAPSFWGEKPLYIPYLSHLIGEKALCKQKKVSYRFLPCDVSLK